MIYLDHAASTPLVSDAYHSLLKYSQDDFANSHAQHSLGKNSQKSIEEIRQYFLASLKAPQKIHNYSFIFTSSATESNNLFIKSLTPQDQDSLWVSSSEHPSLQAPLQYLKNHHYPQITIKKVPEDKYGHIDQLLLEKELDNQGSPYALCLTHIHSISGNLRPLEKLIPIVKEKHPKLKILVDASQSFGKYPLSLENLDIDGLTVSSHKMGGPKGIGGLFIKKDFPIKPLLHGGGHEFGLRSSTLPSPLIHSWKAALAFHLENQEKNLAHVQNLMQRLVGNIKKNIPEAIFPFLTVNQERPETHILNLILPQIPSDVILRFLQEKNIFISTSSACNSKIKKVDPVLHSLHISPQYHAHFMRLSLSFQSQEKEIDTFCHELAKIYAELRTL